MQHLNVIKPAPIGTHVMVLASPVGESQLRKVVQQVEPQQELRNLWILYFSLYTPTELINVAGTSSFHA